MTLRDGGQLALCSELERLRTVTSLMGAAVTLCSRDLRYVWVSQQYGAWVGHRAEELPGRPIADVLGPETFAALQPHFERVLRGERVEFEEEASFRALGRRRVHAVYMPVQGTDGPEGWVAVVEDVTSRRGLEEADARLAAIVESSDDAIVGKTLDGIVTNWNRGAERLFGYTAEEMIGQPIHRLLPPDREDDMARILDTIRAGGRVDHYETDRLRKDGRRLHVSLTVSPIRDASGRIIGVSKIARDVTERHRASAALRETLDVLATLNRTSVLLSAELDMERLLQAMTDAATEVVGARFGAFFYNVVDERGEAYKLYALSGVPREEFADFPMPRNTAVFAATFGGEGVVRLDDVRQDPRYGRNAPYHGTPPGHLPVASYLAVPVSLRGKVLGALLFGHPEPGVFTERDERFVIGLAAQAAVAVDNARLYEAERKARAEAETANRAKDEFLSMVSHELRTPLAAMLGWVAVLRQGKLAPERTARALETIEHSGQVQAALIDDLLDVSRIVSGRLTVDHHDVELRAAIEAALDGVRPDAAAKGVRLDTSLEREVVVVGDPIRLQQVVSNVVGNAVKFTPVERSVHVRLEKTAEAAQVVVRDEGKGIAADFLPHVFEPFRQADDVRRRKSGGLGLGLAIVKHLVELHGGRVTADSAGEGKGSTFTITLPLASAAQTRHTDAERPAEEMRGE